MTPTVEMLMAVHKILENAPCPTPKYVMLNGFVIELDNMSDGERKALGDWIAHLQGKMAEQENK